MRNRFNKPQAAPTRPGDADAIAALVSALSGAGISRSKVDAIITKASRPANGPLSLLGGTVADDRPQWDAKTVHSGKFAGR